MNTIIVHADSKISKALIAIFKALNVSPLPRESLRVAK